MLLLVVLWLTTEKAPATEVQPSVGLNTADAARAWEAVGRVNLVGTGFCTGALIAPNLVLTAAHCMYDKRTGERVKTENVEFLAGWRDGRAAA
ncbi:MAG: trypsin-like serine protease, partial [Alphaproteobacteria bacterium]|nr:trypsin-like serine protease [Alphaproteobacteria bacterium]